MLIQLNIEPSRRLFIILVLVHLLAACALLLSSLNWPSQLIIILALAGHCYYCQPKPTKLIYKDKDQWFIKIADGDWQTAELSAKSLCFNFYILLVLQLKYRRFYLPLLPGDLSSADFRRLRVLLRFYG